MRLLIAEDNPKLLKSLLHIFEKNNFVVDGVSNGDEALAYAQTEEYDGLVLDIMMPGMDGITVLQNLRKMNIKTPALFLTARTEVSQRVEGLDAGADDYLPKPFSTPELLARVRAMLRRKDNYVPDILSYGDVILNRSTYQLGYNDEVQSLSGKEYQIMEMLIARNMADQVIMKSSKSPAAMKEFFSKHKQNMLYMPIINYGAKSWEKHEALFNDYLSTDLPFIAYEMCWNGTLPGENKVFKKVVKSGKHLWINTLWGSLCGGSEDGYYDDRAVGNEDKIYGKILSYGATMIQTDRPAMLIKYLEKKGRHT